MSKHYDIVIVGAGIVGASLANILAKNDASASLSIALVDAAPAEAYAHYRDQDNFDPRVVALSDSSKALLEHAGVWSRVLDVRACPYYRMHVWDGEGTGNISFDSRSSVSDELGHICENRVVVGALHDELREAARHVDLIFEQKLKRISPSACGYELEFESTEKISASLVVGADGAQSKIRELTGLKTKEWDYGHTAIVTTVQTEKSHDYCAWQRFSHRGPLAFLPLRKPGSDKHYCSIVWSVDSSFAEQTMLLDDSAFCAALGEAIEFRLGQVLAADQRFAIQLRQRFAEKYIASGIALVGDAAHTIHPLAGQGVNLGLADIKTLAAEIVRACERDLSIREPATLRRYQRMRQPHNLLTMAGMEAFKRGFSSQDLGVQWLRNTGLKVVDRHPLIKRAFSKFASGNVADG